MNDANKNISESDLEKICYSRALISCFTLFFPIDFRGTLLSCSSVYLRDNKTIVKEFINEFKPSGAFTTIESLKNIYLWIEKEPLHGLELFTIFKTLYSKEIEDETRASLISTFRALRLSLIDKYNDSSFLDKYIVNSYNLFCEATSHIGKETDFMSDNICGSLVDSQVPHETDSTKNYLQKIIPEGGTLLLCDKINIKWDHYNLKTKDSRKLFLTTLYDKLRDFSNNPNSINSNSDNLRVNKYQGIGVLDFPKENGALPTLEQLKKEPETDENSQPRYYPIQCNLENFINMFEGVTEDKPYRTELCKSPLNKYSTSYCLSCLISALHCPQGNRQDVASGFRQLIVNPDGSLIKIEYLRSPTKDRNPDLVSAYEKIIGSAMKIANGTFNPKHKI